MLRVLREEERLKYNRYLCTCIYHVYINGLRLHSVASKRLKDPSVL